MIRKLVVANRGEIARRVFRTCRELGIATVAVHSDADATAPFVTEADQAIRLPGNAPADTYLRGDLIIEAARAAGADAIHPGYGFLSENAAFAGAVEAAGLTWIGPAPESIATMGSKIDAKRLMAAAGVPVLAADLATVTASDLPLLVKASAGGGGRGMRIVDSLDRLADQVARAEAEAASAFGDGTVFAEPYLPTARHVEVQILADTHGTTWVLGDRDCSLQRRHQKVVEEAPAPLLAHETRTSLHAFALAAAQAVGYRGAGTVEFLVDGDRIFFLEMNTRLQVEHPVTECVTGLDLVALQIAVAEGRPLPAQAPPITGHAIEVRLYAEDPAAAFAPQTGHVRAFDIPHHPGVRMDSAVEAGSEVGVHYDAMLAKVIAHAADRDAAIRLLDGVLRRARLHGVTTNLDLLRAVLSDDEFIAGRVHTTLLDERLDRWTAGPDPRSLAKAALAAAIGQATRAAATSTVLDRIPAAWRNAAAQPRRRVYRRGPDRYTVTYSSAGRRLVSDFVTGVTVADAHGDLVVLSDGPIRETYRVTTSGQSVDVDGPAGSVSFELIPTFVDPADTVAPGSLVAPMPAAVTDVAVELGTVVAKGDPIVVLEAMKMQHTVTAPTDGTVTGLTATVGRQVVAGAVLAVIEEKP
ncbi:acetyl/propionyl-CoA carboxylase subuit alpha [Actinoplanes philippinensis]|uniref:Propionyl-CoA carboxylase alpha chain n=1 Tax=Actinoplanes philippinensis TaxID=35752 RepID=A0A1I2FYW9_9ACTN|nr:biotin carboxylase N-terminal domain-containing protein [Actinoplanes philippinensis]GIE76460.1 acetyl/propionyl-CoA carboxylase subuit alpha [Actinoplanes philippinensis]SFF10562.1 propionyl-CoA carboxylase alpha chain [Actinoplanes philippinensis]